MKYIKTSLVQIIEGSQLLLGMKKRGFGLGKWNGFGGKVNPSESLLAAAVREVKEECDLTINEGDLKQIGILLFEFVEGNKLLEVNVFKTSKYFGVPCESDEMLPRFFDATEIPFGQMWKDDAYWYPLMLANKTFFGFFKFHDQHEMLSKHLMEMEDIMMVEDHYRKFLDNKNWAQFVSQPANINDSI